MPRPSPYRLLPGLALLLTAASAQAADCDADGSISCRLSSILHWLDALAILLALILIAVGVLAWRAYRLNAMNHSLPERRDAKQRQS